MPTESRVAKKDITWEQIFEANALEIEAFKEDLGKITTSWLDWGGDVDNIAMRGLRPGKIAVLAGLPNGGKSTCIISWMMSLLSVDEERGEEAKEKNAGVRILDFSLDDPKDARFVQLASCISSRPYYECENPDLCDREAPSPRNRARVLAAHAKVAELWATGRLVTFQRTENFKFRTPLRTVSMEPGELVEMLRIVESFRNKYPDDKIVVFLDALNDFRLEGWEYRPEIERQKEVLGRLMSKATDYKVLFVATAHQNKSEQDGSPNFDMNKIKGSMDLQYGAHWVGGLWNDKKFRGNASKLQTYWKNPRTGEQSFCPIIRVSVAKSKVSGYSDCLYYVMEPDVCRLYPGDEALYAEARGLEKEAVK